ncbi:MAG: amidohydrolase family protein [Alphaproteobacteria bacterium]|nr:amidohydrolase family protein [Alphaproteobacteria bacterium]
MADILIRSARIVDGTTDKPKDAVDIRIADGKVQELGAGLSAGGAREIDARNAYVMPGLIDAHVHVNAVLADLKANAALPDAVVMVRSLKVMNAMLMRGFTTVRDLGGATGALRAAAEEAPVATPRLNIPGKALSQTGGHCDHRGRYDESPLAMNNPPLGAMGVIADGVDAVRLAARAQIKGGADYIKIMANGGVASPTDPIHFLQYSRDEIKAIVEEAENVGTYVAAHLYTDAAILRAVQCGVRSLEHCNLITPETAALAAAARCIACPTLITYDKLSSDGAAMGLPAASIAKVDDVRLAGLKSLEIMADAGLPMAYGSDLLGGMHKYQAGEFELRGRVLPAPMVISSATIIAAKLMCMEGKIGTLEPGAFGDLILVDGNPLDDLSLLGGQGEHIPTIIKGGEVIKG